MNFLFKINLYIYFLYIDMKRGLVILFLGIVFLVSFTSAATYYVDCSRSSNGDGSFASPWNNIASVNSKSFSTGDDVYFKTGTTCIMTEPLNIDWEGSSGDHIVIGAYYGDKQFGLNGNSRPIIDGNSNTVPGRTTDQGLINKVDGIGYIDVENLKIANSGSYGILFNYLDNISITNCWSYRSWKSGIWLGGSDNIFLSENIVNENCQDNYQSDTVVYGGAMVVCRSSSGGVVSNNRIFNNHCTETLGFNRGAEGITVEHNIIYDNHKHSLYLDAVKGMAVRNNIIYSSADAVNWIGTRDIPWGDNNQQ
jgi:hypothetical protein